MPQEAETKIIILAQDEATAVFGRVADALNRLEKKLEGVSEEERKAAGTWQPEGREVRPDSEKTRVDSQDKADQSQVEGVACRGRARHQDIQEILSPGKGRHVQEPRSSRYSIEDSRNTEGGDIMNAMTTILVVHYKPSQKGVA